jgi:hypothetical protein
MAERKLSIELQLRRRKTGPCAQAQRLATQRRRALITKEATDLRAVFVAVQVRGDNFSRVSDFVLVQRRRVTTGAVYVKAFRAIRVGRARAGKIPG